MTDAPLRNSPVRRDDNLDRTPLRAVAMATGLAAFYLVLVTGQRAVDAYSAKQGVDAVRQEISLLQARNLELQNQLSSAQEAFEIEKTARQELGWVKPGDTAVMLVWPGGEPSPGSIDRAPAGRAQEPNWRSWLDLFVDRPAPVR